MSHQQTIVFISKIKNNSWKPEFVSSFNMGNIIFVKMSKQDPLTFMVIVIFLMWITRLCCN